MLIIIFLSFSIIAQSVANITCAQSSPSQSQIDSCWYDRKSFSFIKCNNHHSRYNPHHEISCNQKTNHGNPKCLKERSQLVWKDLIEFYVANENQNNEIVEKQALGLQMVCGSNFRGQFLLLRRIHRQGVPKPLSEPHAYYNQQYTMLIIINNTRTRLKYYGFFFGYIYIRWLSSTLIRINKAQCTHNYKNQQCTHNFIWLYQAAWSLHILELLARWGPLFYVIINVETSHCKLHNGHFCLYFPYHVYSISY